MSSLATQPRVPAGTPAGGQYATNCGERALVVLTDTASPPLWIRTNRDDPHRFDVDLTFPSRDHTSISQLTTWQRCQLRWALQQHGIDEQPPEEPTAPTRYAEAVERRDRGVRFHAAAEAAVNGDDASTNFDESIGQLLDGWRRAEPGLDPRSSRAEVEIRGHLLDEGTGELVPFLGYADRVDTLPDETVRLVDYKTGSSPYLGTDGDEQVPDDGVRRVHRPAGAGLTQAELQLLTYADQIGERASTIRVVYPATTRNNGPLIVDRDVTDTDLAHARAVCAHLLGQISAAEGVGTVTTSDGAGCTSCGYHRHCPQQGAEPPNELRKGPR